VKRIESIKIVKWKMEKEKKASGIESNEGIAEEGRTRHRHNNNASATDVRMHLFHRSVGGRGVSQDNVVYMLCVL